MTPGHGTENVDEPERLDIGTGTAEAREAETLNLASAPRRPAGADVKPFGVGVGVAQTPADVTHKMSIKAWNRH